MFPAQRMKDDWFKPIMGIPLPLQVIGLGKGIWQLSSIRHKKISAKQLQEKLFLPASEMWRRRNLALLPAFTLGCMRKGRWDSSAFLRGKPWGWQSNWSWTLIFLIHCINSETTSSRHLVIWELVLNPDQLSHFLSPVLITAAKSTINS